MYFIANSNININKMLINEESFIKSYLLEFFTNASIRSKIYIKNPVNEKLTGFSYF